MCVCEFTAAQYEPLQLHSRSEPWMWSGLSALEPAVMFVVLLGEHTVTLDLSEGGVWV